MLDSKLYRKYNVPGPRYTSYPTVPYWDRSPRPEEWVGSVKRALTESEGEGAAIYIHVPFCKTLCTYCGCNTRITQRTDVGDPYVNTVLKEWELYNQTLRPEQPIPVAEMHLGGGTPTFLSAKELTHLVSNILKKVRIADGAEFSLEVDPRVTTQEQLSALFDLGFRRISLGVQDFDIRVQKTVNRVQTFEQVEQVTQWARDLGYTSVNFDLIYGLPFQTLESIEQTFKHVNQLRPDRIAFYSYAHVPWIKPGQRKFTEADLPSAEDKRNLYERGRALLEEQSYQEVGMDHFALTTDSLWKSVTSKTLHRNFMGYSTHFIKPLIGLGVSAIGDSGYVFSQNEKQLEKYIRRVEAGELPLLRGHVLNEEDLSIRRHILNVMTQFETDLSVQSTEFLKSVAGEMSEFTQDNLVKMNSDKLMVTERGRPFLRNICMAMDARLSRKSPDRQLFSQTV